MKESVTYQAILEEGEAIGISKGEAIGISKGEVIGLTKGEAIGQVEGIRRSVLHAGAKRFGAPDQRQYDRIMAMDSVEELESLLDRILEAADWHEALN